MSRVPEQAPAGREWVDGITEIRQRVLALAIPSLCANVGLAPEDLAKTWPTDPMSRAKSGMVTVALGSIICLGREMAIRWTNLQGPQLLTPGRTVGQTQIRDLHHCHRATNAAALLRYEAFCTLGPTGRAFALEVDAIRDEVIPLWQRWHKEALERKLREKPPRKKRHQAIDANSSRACDQASTSRGVMLTPESDGV